jgi:hypothetical protein
VTRIPNHTIQDAPGASRPIFTAYFRDYAQTPVDLPADPAAAGQPE